MNSRLFTILLYLLAVSGAWADDAPGGFFSSTQRYAALGRLFVPSVPGDPSRSYDSQMQYLGSDKLMKMARMRVADLHRELAQSRVEIHVLRGKDSMLVRVVAVGEEKEFTRVILDALLDEFLAKQAADERTGRKDSIAQALSDWYSAETECLALADQIAAGPTAQLQEKFDKAKAHYSQMKDRVAHYDVSKDRRCYLVERPDFAIPLH